MDGDNEITAVYNELKNIRAVFNWPTLPIGTLSTRPCTLFQYIQVQYRLLIPAPIDRTSASAWLYKDPWVTSNT